MSLNEWHVVRVSRTGRDGYLQLDHQAAVEGMSKGAYTQLTLTLDLFIGGHRNFDEVAKNANIQKAFKGCIQKVNCFAALFDPRVEFLKIVPSVFSVLGPDHNLFAKT